MKSNIILWSKYFTPTRTKIYVFKSNFSYRVILLWNHLDKTNEKYFHNKKKSDLNYV